MILDGGEHSIAWSLPEASDYSIDVPATLTHHTVMDEGSQIILAHFICPYCWKESNLIVIIMRGKQPVICCQKYQRDFPLTFDW
jgi:hypothetical protein